MPAQSHFSAGVKALRAGQPKRAVRLLKRALSEAPDDADTHFCIAYAYFRLKHFSDCLPHYEKVIQLDPERRSSYNDLGIALTRLGRYADAIDVYNRVLGLYSDYTLAHFNVAEAYSKNQQFDLAIFHYKKTLELDPGMAVAYNNIGNLYFRQRRWHEASLYFEEAYRADSSHTDALYNFGLTFVKMHDWDAAIVILEKYLTICPFDKKAKAILRYVIALDTSQNPEENIQHRDRGMTNQADLNKVASEEIRGACDDHSNRSTLLKLLKHILKR